MLRRRTCYSSISVSGTYFRERSSTTGYRGTDTDTPRGRGRGFQHRGASSSINYGGDDEEGADLFTFSSAASPPPQASNSSILKINSWLSRERKEVDDPVDSAHKIRRGRHHTTPCATDDDHQAPNHNRAASTLDISDGDISVSGGSPFHSQAIHWSTLGEFQKKDVFGPTTLPYEMAFRLFINSGKSPSSSPSPSLSPTAGGSGSAVWLQAMHAFVGARRQLVSICPPRPSDYLTASKHCTSLPAICSIYAMMEEDYGTDGGTIPPPTMRVLQEEAAATIKKASSSSSHRASSSPQSSPHNHQLLLDRLVLRERRSQALLLDALRSAHLGKLAMFFPQLEANWNPYLRSKGQKEFPPRAAALLELMEKRGEVSAIEKRIKNGDGVTPLSTPSKDDARSGRSQSADSDSSSSNNERPSKEPYYSPRTDLSPEYHTALSILMDGAKEGYSLRSQGKWEEAIPFYRNLISECQETLPTIVSRTEQNVIRARMISQNTLLFANVLKSASWEVALTHVTPTLEQKVRTIATIVNHSWIAALHLIAAKRSRALNSTTRLSPPSILSKLFRNLSGRVPHAWRVALHSVQDAILASPTLTTWSSPSNITVTDRDLPSSSLRGSGGGGGGTQSSSLPGGANDVRRYGSIIYEQHALQYLLLASILHADLNRRHLGSQTSYETGMVLSKAQRIPEDQWGETLFPMASYVLYRNTFNGYLQVMSYFVTPFNVHLEKRSMSTVCRLCAALKKGICVVDANMLERVILNLTTISAQLTQEAGGALTGIQFIVPFPVMLEYTGVLRRSAMKHHPNSGKGRSSHISNLGILSLMHRATRPHSVASRDDLGAPIIVFALERELPSMVFNAINDLHGASSMWVIDKHVASVALSAQMGLLTARDHNLNLKEFTHFHIKEALGRHTGETFRGNVWIATKDAELRAHSLRCGLGVYPAGLVAEGTVDDDTVDTEEDTAIPATVVAEDSDDEAILEDDREEE